MGTQSGEPKESSIAVAVRVRPFTEQEKQHLIQPVTDNLFQSDGSLASSSQGHRSAFQPKGLRKILNVVDDRMLVFDPSGTNALNHMANNALAAHKSHNRPNNRIREHRFIFDRLFDEDASQEAVYNATTKPLLDSVLDGFNSTVFAYGATGCGKTHTITGTSESPGIIFSTMQELFEKIEERKESHIIELTLSYLEIYNESIRDLLSYEDPVKPLTIREDQTKRITVCNLSSYKPESVEHVMELIMTGNSNRTISPTEANATSSRSHAVLQINVDAKPRTASLTEQHTYATLSIIDLAGSERASSTKNTGERLHEGANINRSLLALGNCINALCDPRRRNHVPYRDSKLTRLLKFSLGGNCKTVMIVCVSPSSSHYDETLNTLKYANRAKEIKTKVIRNQHNLSRHVGSYLKMITEQKQEIEELRSREAKHIDAALLKLSLQKEKNMKLMLEGVDEISGSIAKHSNIQMQKAYVLAKRKIVSVLKADIENFLTSFDRIFNIEDEADLTEFDSIIPGFSSILHKAETLLTTFVVQIEDFEKAYSEQTELDYILDNSSKSIGNRLSELESWTSFDSLNFELHITKLKDTVERNILYQSSVFFDQSIGTLSCFKSPYSSLLFLLKSHLENETVKIETLARVVKEISSKFDKLLQNDINLNISESVFSATPILASPKKKGYKRSTSPLHRSPVKIAKPKSPTRAFKQAKKVRWEVPSNDPSFYQEKDGESLTETDDSMDQEQSSATEKNDANMKDTPLHEKLQRGMNISPPTSKNNNYLKAFKTKARNTSLTSIKLVPPKAVPSSSDTERSNAKIEPSSSAESFKIPKSEPHINFVGSLSPSRPNINLGPPQRIFQPLKFNLEDKKPHSKSLPTSNDGLDESASSTTTDGDWESNSAVNKENEPVPSVFGDISSIF